MKRRELFQQIAAATVAMPFVTRSRASAEPAQAAEGPSRFLPGFTISKVQTSGGTVEGSKGQIQTAGTTITVAKGGDGPPLLLLHGAPMTHITWRLTAPQLAKS